MSYTAALFGGVFSMYGFAFVGAELVLGHPWHAFAWWMVLGACGRKCFLRLMGPMPKKESR